MIPALRRKRLADLCEFQGSLWYRVKPYLKKEEEEEKQEEEEEEEKENQCLDSPVAKSTCCPYRGPGFGSLGSSEPSVTPVPGDPMPASYLRGHRAHTQCT